MMKLKKIMMMEKPSPKWDWIEYKRESWGTVFDKGVVTPCPESRPIQWLSNAFSSLFGCKHFKSHCRIHWIWVNILNYRQWILQHLLVREGLILARSWLQRVCNALQKSLPLTVKWPGLVAPQCFKPTAKMYCVEIHFSVLQYTSVCCTVLKYTTTPFSVLQRAVFCTVLR